MLEPWQQILTEAADIIERRGWSQGALYGQGGGVCLLGAIKLAFEQMDPELVRNQAHPALKHLREYLHISKHGRYVSLPQWNDAPDREAYEVIATLRLAAGVEPLIPVAQ